MQKATDQVSYVLYKSRSREQCEASCTIADILRSSLRNNKRDGVTGFLHFEHAGFYQYFEGPSPAVDALYSRLEQDRRHWGMIVLERGTRAERRFSDFDMGFSKASGRWIADSFSDLLDDPTITQIMAFLSAQSRLLATT